MSSQVVQEDIRQLLHLLSICELVENGCLRLLVLLAGLHNVQQSVGNRVHPRQVVTVLLRQEGGKQLDYHHGVFAATSRLNALVEFGVECFLEDRLHFEELFGEEICETLRGEVALEQVGQGREDLQPNLKEVGLIVLGMLLIHEDLQDITS